MLEDKGVNTESKHPDIVATREAYARSPQILFTEITNRELKGEIVLVVETSTYAVYVSI